MSRRVGAAAARPAAAMSEVRRVLRCILSLKIGWLEDPKMESFDLTWDLKM